MTKAELRRWLYYDPDTGIFIARAERANIKGVGREVGWTDDRGYRRLFLRRKLYLAHRLAWFWVYGKWPKHQLDHINGKRSDNRICNLREATAAQNAYAKHRHTRGASGYKGVTKAKRRGVWCGRWQAQIGHRWEVHHLGYFRDLKKAALAYDEAAIKLFGPFAKTNASLGLL